MQPIQNEETSERIVPEDTTPHLKTLRTYQGDIADTIHTNNESVISIAVAEEKQKTQEDGTKTADIHTVLTEKKENPLLTYGILPLVGLILIIVGGGSIYGVYYYIQAKNQPIIVKTESVLIQYSNKKVVPVETLGIKATVEKTFSDLKSSNETPGSVLYTNFTQGSTSVATMDFLGAIGPSAPQSLLRSLSNTYISGIYTVDANNTVPFFIFSSDSFGTTYAGMLAWETTLPDNLFSFFRNGKGAIDPQWIDESFNNHDLRALRNTAGDIVIVYGFIDKNILIITANEQTFESLSKKYINARLIK